MHIQMNEAELEVQKTDLLETIKSLESDIRCPLDSNLDDQATQTSNQIITKRLLDVERNNLQEINVELDKMKNELQA